MRVGSNPIADTSGWSQSQCKEKKACSVAWGGFKIQASAADMCGWSHRESFRLSISNPAYSEPGSPFPDCREGLTDRLSSSVLLPGIEPRTGRKGDAAITTELIPALRHRKRRGNQRNACSAPHSKLHRSPSVTSNACVTSNGYLPAAVSLPEWLRGT